MKTEAIAEREQEETKWTDFRNVYIPETETYVSNSVLIRPTSNSRFQSKSAAGTFCSAYMYVCICDAYMNSCVYVHSCGIVVKI